MAERLKVTQAAKNAAKRALEKRKNLPKSKKFGLSPSEAKRQGIKSGVSRARQLISKDSISLSEAKSVAKFYNRFKNQTGEGAKGAIGLWGGKGFGRKAAAFVKSQDRKKKN